MVAPVDAVSQAPADHRNTFRIAYAVTALGVFGASAVSPVLPDIGAAFGVDAAKSSLMVSLFILPMALLSLPIGIVADRLTPRPLLAACLILYGAAGVACAFAPDFDTLLFFRVLQGCGAAALELFGLVIIIEAADPTELHEVIGRNAGIIGVSTAIAPIFSGALSLLSWRASFLSALIAFPLAAVVWRRLPSLGRPDPTPLSMLREFLAQPVVKAALFSTLLTFLFLFGVLFSFVPDKATQIGVQSGLLIALVPTASAVAIGLVAPRMGALLDRWGALNVMSFSYMLYALAMIAFAAGGHLLVLILGSSLLGAAHGLLFPLIQTMLARRAPSERSVIFMALNVAIIGVGQTLSPLIMAGIFEVFGLTAVFIVAAAVAVTMTFTSRILFRSCAD